MAEDEEAVQLLATLAARETAASNHITALFGASLEDSSLFTAQVGVVQEDLAALRAAARDLEILIEEEDMEEQVQRLAVVLKGHQAEYDRLQTAFKQANVQARRNMEAAAAAARKALLAGGAAAQGLRRAGGQASAIATSQGVTHTLQRTRQLMAQELEHTGMALAAMDVSSGRLAAGREELRSQRGLFASSSRLLRTLFTSSIWDTVSLYFGLAVFVLVCAYVVQKRTLYFAPVGRMLGPVNGRTSGVAWNHTRYAGSFAWNQTRFAASTAQALTLDAARASTGALATLQRLLQQGKPSNGATPLREPEPTTQPQDEPPLLEAQEQPSDGPLLQQPSPNEPAGDNDGKGPPAAEAEPHAAGNNGGEAPLAAETALDAAAGGGGDDLAEGAAAGPHGNDGSASTSSIDAVLNAEHKPALGEVAEAMGTETDGSDFAAAPEAAAAEAAPAVETSVQGGSDGSCTASGPSSRISMADTGKAAVPQAKVANEEVSKAATGADEPAAGTVAGDAESSIGTTNGSHTDAGQTTAEPAADAATAEFPGEDGATVSGGSQSDSQTTADSRNEAAAKPSAVSVSHGSSSGIGASVKGDADDTGDSGKELNDPIAGLLSAEAADVQSAASGAPGAILPGGRDAAAYREPAGKSPPQESQPAVASSEQAMAAADSLPQEEQLLHDRKTAAAPELRQQPAAAGMLGSGSTEQAGDDHDKAPDSFGDAMSDGSGSSGASPHAPALDNEVGAEGAADDANLHGSSEDAGATLSEQVKQHSQPSDPAASYAGSADTPAAADGRTTAEPTAIPAERRAAAPTAAEPATEAATPDTGGEGPSAAPTAQFADENGRILEWHWNEGKQTWQLFDVVSNEVVHQVAPPPDPIGTMQPATHDEL